MYGRKSKVGRAEPINMPRPDNMADGLTRLLGGPEFRKFVGLLGIKSGNFGAGQEAVINNMALPKTMP